MTEDCKISELRELLYKSLKSVPSPHRQSLRLMPKAPSLKDSDSIKDLSISNGDKIYIRDLGPQIGWKTVFLAEYAGPLIVYLLFYFFPQWFYSNDAFNSKGSQSLTTVL